VTAPRRPFFLSWLKLAEHLVFPSTCRLCSAFLDEPGFKIVCRECWAGVRPAGVPFCPRCGRFYAGGAAPSFCQDCLDFPSPFTLHRSCGFYEGKLRDIILLFKYKRMRILGQGLAAFIQRSLAGESVLWKEVDAVVPVPLHPRRKRERGYNQALVLAAEVAGFKGLDLLDKCLVKIRNAPPQASLEARARRENVRGAYRTAREKNLRGKIILLVDDVYTTGATLRECARVLKKAGAKEIRAITVAQA